MPGENQKKPKKTIDEMGLEGMLIAVVIIILTMIFKG